MRNARISKDQQHPNPPPPLPSGGPLTLQTSFSRDTTGILIKKFLPAQGSKSRVGVSLAGCSKRTPAPSTTLCQSATVRLSVPLTDKNDDLDKCRRRNLPIVSQLWDTRLRHCTPANRERALKCGARGATNEDGEGRFVSISKWAQWKLNERTRARRAGPLRGQSPLACVFVHPLPLGYQPIVFGRSGCLCMSTYKRYT